MKHCGPRAAPVGHNVQPLMHSNTQYYNYLSQSFLSLSHSHGDIEIRN